MVFKSERPFETAIPAAHLLPLLRFKCGGGLGWGRQFAELHLLPQLLPQKFPQLFQTAFRKPDAGASLAVCVCPFGMKRGRLKTPFSGFQTASLHQAVCAV